MTVGEVAELLAESDRVQIHDIRGNVLMVGWAANLTKEDRYKELLSRNVITFRQHAELRHKDWEKLGLVAPIEPEEAPNYRFADLDLKLYVIIYVKRG